MSDSPRRLIFLRHGITALQEQGRYCGHVDPPLSPWGREQVIRSKEVILHWHPAHVWCSDLQRCTETALLVYPRFPHRLLPAFREIAFGDFENKLYSEIASDVNQILMDPDRSFPSGESLRTLSCRVATGMREILSEDGETAVVIGHAGSIAVAALRLLERPLSCFWSFQLPHAGTAVFEHCGEGWKDVAADWNRKSEGSCPA